jgi:hypothetical protein
MGVFIYLAGRDFTLVWDFLCPLLAESGPANHIFRWAGHDL